MSQCQNTHSQYCLSKRAISTMSTRLFADSIAPKSARTLIARTQFSEQAQDGISTSSLGVPPSWKSRPSTTTHFQDTLAILSHTSCLLLTKNFSGWRSLFSTIAGATNPGRAVFGDTIQRQIFFSKILLWWWSWWGVEDYQYECLAMTLESGPDQIKDLKDLWVLDVQRME